MNEAVPREISLIAPRNTPFPLKSIQGCGTLAKNSACKMPETRFSSCRKIKGYLDYEEPIKEKRDFSCTLSSFWFLTLRFT
jgi:hypothetical protein